MDLPLSVGPVVAAAVTGAQRTAFLFGKLPAHGDFVSRGFDSDQARTWDLYLSESLHQAQAMLDDYAQLYGMTPAWRLMLELDGLWCGGVIALSQDRVGRQFPILVMAACGAHEAPQTLAKLCEEELYTVFAQGLSADQLLERAQAIAATDDGDLERSNRWWLEDIEARPIAVLEGPRPPHLISQMLQSARLSL